jgi:hypothetical protein
VIAASNLFAVGSAAIATLSLCLNVWVLVRQNRRRPQLSIAIDRAPDDPASSSEHHDYVMTASFDDGETPRAPTAQTRWIRLRVANARNRDTAREVQVLASTPPRVSGWPGLDTRPLTWTSARTEDDKPAVSVAIPAGVERQVDLARALIDMRHEEASRAELTVYPAPQAHGNALRKGEPVTVRLMLAGSDINASGWEVLLEFDGERVSVVSGPTRLAS